MVLVSRLVKAFPRVAIVEKGGFSGTVNMEVWQC